MTPSELHSLASGCYGSRWQSQLARDMGIALRTVQRWARDGISKPATSEGVRRFLEERRISRIAAPPEGTTPDQDRDVACSSALRPAVTALVAAAVDVGWHPAEAVTTVLAVAVDEMLRHGTPEAAVETLQHAINGITSLSARS